MRLEKFRKIVKYGIEIYKRGKKEPFIPELVYSSDSDKKIFCSPLEALIYTQKQDYVETLKTFKNRSDVIRNQMKNRNAPKEQMGQLEQVVSRYEQVVNREDEEK